MKVTDVGGDPADDAANTQTNPKRGHAMTKKDIKPTKDNAEQVEDAEASADDRTAERKSSDGDGRRRFLGGGTHY